MVADCTSQPIMEPERCSMCEAGARGWTALQCSVGRLHCVANGSFRSR